MGIREDIILRGSDGGSYKWRSGARNFQNTKTGRFATREVRYDLIGEVLERRLVIGESTFKELLELSRIGGNKDPEWGRSVRRDMMGYANSVSRVKGGKVRSELLVESEFRGRNGVRVGRPCMFYYEAKHKGKLPYWDSFPVIIPISVGSDSFIGLNFHYLRPELRSYVLDILYSTMLRGQKYRGDIYEKVRLGKLPESAIQSMTEGTYFDITYSKIMSKLSSSRYFKPMIHKYLISQVRSRVIEITPRGWTMCLFLPTAKFEKSSIRNVWLDSDRKTKEI